MSNLMQRAATWLGERLQVAAGRTVTYRRKDQQFTVTGWPAKVDYEVDDEDGIPRKVTFHDWTFTYADAGFENDDAAFVPRPGDQIEETVNGNLLTYEVMPLNKRPAHEWADSAGVLLLVHTKLVGQCQPS